MLWGIKGDQQLHRRAITATTYNATTMGPCKAKANHKHTLQVPLLSLQHRMKDDITGNYNSRQQQQQSLKPCTRVN